MEALTQAARESSHQNEQPRTFEQRQSLLRLLHGPFKIPGPSSQPTDFEIQLWSTDISTTACEPVAYVAVQADHE